MSYKSLPNCLNSSILALFLLLFQVAGAQGPFTDLDQAITARQKQLGKSFVVQVWKAGDTLAYSKVTGEMMTVKTSVPMGAASNWLTASLVLMFVEEGKIALDDKITKWLPEFEKYGKNYITIEHCLTNMTGIQGDGSGVGRIFQKKKFSSLEEEVNGFAAKEIQTNPGTEFRYSEVGMNIAARVLEVVSKKKFDQLIKQRLFTPLKMRSTSFANLTGGPVDPSGGAYSTADDYMKFLVMLLNKGTYHGRRLLSEGSVDLLLKPVTIDQSKNIPKSLSVFVPAIGSWIANKDRSDNKSTIFTSPGLPGSWPVIDLCRGYAYLFVTKDADSDEKANLQWELKSVVDSHFKEGCKN